MGVDVLHLVGIQVGIAQGIDHGESGAVAVLGGRGDVVGIPAHAKADELGVDARAALARVLEFLQQHGAAAVAQHEAIAVLVPRAARLLRGLVARRQRLGLPEAAQSAARGGHFSAAGDDHVGIAVLNGAHPEPDGVRRGGARGHHAEVGTLQSETDREVPGDHVDNGGGHEERRDLARVHRLQVLAVFDLDSPQTADAGAAHRAAARRVGLGEIDPRVGDRLHSGRDAVLHELVHAARFLGRDVLRDVETVHLSAEAHRKRRHVKTRHRADAAVSAQHRIPCRLDGAPDRGHHSKTRYDNTALAHTLPVWRAVRLRTCCGVR